MDGALDKKIFCPGQNYFVLYKYDFVQDKKYFVRADGQGISINVLNDPRKD